ncbi:MAG: alpha/beta hydrolase [Leptolyngbya sp. SIO4C1]|nr:alpha/beta hydrolase [Leptolyngbya sp. SIO4C1]
MLLLGGGVASLYLSVCLFLYVYQPRLIFKPDLNLGISPADLQLEYEEIWLPAGRSQLHGWWLPTPESDRVLLYLHGNGENISANLEHARRYQQMGFSVLLFDYRGYGRSQGPFPSEQRVYEDAALGWNYLTQQRQIDPQNIWIFGHSLGGAIAIDLAVKHPEAAGLIVESSFSSMQAAVASTGQYGWIPVNLILHQRFDSLTKVAQLQLPVFYIHGLADETLPAYMSQDLYAASPEPKALWLVPNADHNDVASTAGEQYFQQVQAFIADHQ